MLAFDIAEPRVKTTNRGKEMTQELKDTHHPNKRTTVM